MAIKKPNTLCKNRNCTHGTDGGRKHYYTCRYCTHSENWRAVACSWECYLAYQSQLIEARNTNQVVDTVPERTDMSRDEVVALINETETEQVVAETEIELADEIEENPTMGFGDIVDAINAELDLTAKKRTKKAHKKEE